MITENASFRKKEGWRFLLFLFLIAIMKKYQSNMNSHINIKFNYINNESFLFTHLSKTIYSFQLLYIRVLSITSKYFQILIAIFLSDQQYIPFTIFLWCIIYLLMVTWFLYTSCALFQKTTSEKLVHHNLVTVHFLFVNLT